MSTQLTEFDLAAIAALGGPVSTMPASVVDEPSVDTSITISNPVPPPAPQKRVTLYAQSINQVSYSDNDSMACFDIVFSVGVLENDDTTKTYQVVKRISLDKYKLAAEAENTQVSAVVEAKKESVPEKKPMISEAKRYRVLAGLE
jgi:hypothetical protein